MKFAKTFGKTTPPKNARSWQSVLARCLTATLLAYFLIYKFGQVMAVLLPMPRSEIVYFVGLLQITALVPLVLWIFTARSLRRMLAIILAGTAASVIFVHLHGPV